MRASMPMNLERSECPKGERAKLKSPSSSCASVSVESSLYSVLMSRSHSPAIFKYSHCPAWVGCQSSPVLLNKGTLERHAGRMWGQKKDGERLAPFTVSVKGESFVFAFGVMHFLQAFNSSLGGLSTHDKQ